MSARVLSCPGRGLTWRRPSSHLTGSHRMSHLAYCPTCQNPYSKGAPYCSSCGNSRYSAPAVDQSNNAGGTNMHAGRDIHLGDTERWDTRTKAVMDRDAKRPVWPADRISAISGIMTIASFLGIGWLPDLTAPLALFAMALGIVTLLAFAAGNDLRTYGTHVLPLRWGTLERAQDGSTWLTDPVAACPWCPKDRPARRALTQWPSVGLRQLSEPP